MRKKLGVARPGAWPCAASGAPQAMDVATFLAKADALQGKGMLALFSSDIGLLKREISADVEGAGRRSEGRRSAGRPQRFCPSPGRWRSTATRSSPPSGPSRRRAPATDVRQPLKALLARKYPCR